MKIRNGFVSNSSSSSYVIAYKEPEKCTHCGRSDINIISLIGRGDDCGDTYISKKGYDDVVDGLKEWLDDDITDDIIAEMDELNDGTYKFAIAYVAYHDETLPEVLKTTKSIKILYKGD